MIDPFNFWIKCFSFVCHRGESWRAKTGQHKHPQLLIYGRSFSKLHCERRKAVGRRVTENKTKCCGFEIEMCGTVVTAYTAPWACGLRFSPCHWGGGCSESVKYCRLFRLSEVERDRTLNKCLRACSYMSNQSTLFYSTLCFDSFHFTLLWSLKDVSQKKTCDWL